ncbi:MAG: DUF2066 domain-containing protein [Gammaproteobacteria bacterium]|nr:DUF2066 domain-containing protein [Gammaproteobacteria bacterium]
MWFDEESSARRRLRLCLLLCVLFGSVAGAQAGEVEGLYEAQVPVSGQREAERTNALRAAFGQVLVKITGDRDAAVRPGLQALLRSPLQYVQQYLYRPLPTGYIPAAGADPVPTQLLWARFDAQAVNQSLQGVSQPVWGRMRPSTLVWLAVEDQGRRYLAGSDAGADLRRELEARADARGIPLLFPLLDLEDQRRVGFADVWGGFDQEVRAASARYQSSAVMLGRVYRTPAGDWSARWSLYVDGGAEHWESATGSRAQTLADGVDGAADRLASRFARAVGGDVAEPVDLLVTGVDRLEDYGRVQHYLRSLDPVSGLEVRQIDAAGAHFHLVLHGDRAALVQAIGFGRVLVPAAGADAGPELAYRLLP